MAKILSKLGEQQLVMVNYACGFNQSEMGKYFEWIIIIIQTAGDGDGQELWLQQSCLFYATDLLLWNLALKSPFKYYDCCSLDWRINA